MQTTSRLIAIISFSLIGIYAYYVYQQSDDIQRSAIRKIVLSSLLVLFTPILNIVNPLIPFDTYILIHGPQYFGVMILAIAIDQMLNKIRYIPIINTHVFTITLIFYIPILLLSYLTSDIRLSFTDGKPIPHTWSFYTLSTLDFGIMLYLFAYVCNLHRNRLARNMPTKPFIRFSISGFAFKLGLLAFTIVEIGIILSFPGNDQIIPPTTAAYRTIMIAGSTLLMLSFLLPDLIVSQAANRIDTHRENIYNEQIKYIKYLHNRIIKIVPGVSMYRNNQTIEEIVIEISDAIMLFRSHHLTIIPIAFLEARGIYKALHTNNLISEGGKYPIPSIHYNEMRYYAAVGRYLERMETR